jgi:replication factor C subunit 1
MEYQWVEKYKPKLVNEIIGNKQEILTLNEWLNNFWKIKETITKKVYGEKKTSKTKKRSKKNDSNSCLLITGNHGIGKTTFVELILKNDNYEIHYLSLNDFKDGKSFQQYIQTITNVNTMTNYLKNTKKIAIIVDKLETITSKLGKTNIIKLQKDNDIYWHLPIIFISSNKHTKLLSLLKKSCEKIKMVPPIKYELKPLLIKIAINEKLYFRNKM